MTIPACGAQVIKLLGTYIDVCTRLVHKVPVSTFAKELSVRGQDLPPTVDCLKTEILFLPLACCVALEKSPCFLSPNFLRYNMR